MQPKISVIVPVYKAEKYLHRCVDSILAQTFTDFELLLINDGSPDNCGSICDEYAVKDSRIKVIHKENGGVTAARADGVKQSNGEWITFVDADDTIPQNALNTYNNNICSDIDIIKGAYNSIGPEQEFIYKTTILDLKEYRRETIHSHFIYPAPWGALIRKTLFNSKTFDIPKDLVFGEDAIMNIRLAFSTKKDVKLISDKVYNYIQRKDSCAYTFIPSYQYNKKRYYYVIDSIPKEERDNYMHECIDFRLAQIKILRMYYIKNNIWKIDSFHKELLHDIKKSNYKISKIKKIAISFSTPLTNYIYLVLNKIYKACKSKH